MGAGSRAANTGTAHPQRCKYVALKICAAVAMKTAHLQKEEEVVSFYFFICPACKAKNQVGWNTSRQRNVAFDTTERRCKACDFIARIVFDEDECGRGRQKPRRKRSIGKDEED